MITGSVAGKYLFLSLILGTDPAQFHFMQSASEQRLARSVSRDTLIDLPVNSRKVALRYNNCNDTYDHIQRRKPGSLEYEELPPLETRPEKVFNMDEERIGRPTQVHAVPPEERAVDSQGNELPWALEWHE